VESTREHVKNIHIFWAMYVVFLVAKLAFLSCRWKYSCVFFLFVWHVTITYRQFVIGIFFIFYFSLKKYTLIFFVLGISLSNIILLNFNFCSCLVYKHFSLEMKNAPLIQVKERKDRLRQISYPEADLRPSKKGLDSGGQGRIPT
jgi:glucan phosphoethanolaminetransferase (alkaline phosphatase superfamily)